MYPYLLRNLAVIPANEVWALDTTSGWHVSVYLAAVVDVATRRVLADKVATTLESYHAVEIMDQAYARYGMPDIVNTDQGSQFTAEEFTDVVLSRGVKLSMDRKGAWRDNVFVERLWRSVKYERAYLRVYDNVSAARRDLAQYFDWYNEERLHSSLGKQTPDQTYWQLLPTMKAAA